MFQEWGFLLGEIWGLLALAALIGLFAGWIIWARGAWPTGGTSTIAEADLAERDARIADLQAQLTACEMARRDAPAAEVGAQAQAELEAPDPVTDAADQGPGGGVKPKTLTAARDGQPDDLKQIKGIGPKMEDLCHNLGFFHFDQIAEWTAEEVAWVDANLEGFKGRVTRDGWVSQARMLAETE